VALQGGYYSPSRQVDYTKTAGSSSDGGELRVGVYSDRGDAVLEREPVVSRLEVLNG
jgi:hypothetical protein